MAPTGVVRTQYVDHINVRREPQLALQATLFFIVNRFRELIILVYETDSRDVTRGRCAIPDDALDSCAAGGRRRI